MSVDITLRNGIVILNGKETQRSVSIRGGSIEGIYEVGNEPDSKDVIDCSGRYILPGAIDVHVHLRDMKQSEKEDFETGTKAAAVGGVTTVIDMPNSSPPLLNADVLEEKIVRARLSRFVNVGFHAGIPKDVSEYDSSFAGQVMGFKVYPHAPLDSETEITKERALECAKLSKRFDRPLLIHPDIPHDEHDLKGIDEYLERYSCDNEIAAIRMFLQAQSDIDGRLHICHVSCSDAAKLISDNRAEDRLTAEVTPHHLLLSGDDFLVSDGRAKMLPPLRTKKDNAGLREFLSCCGIDIIASDHAPHKENEKTAQFLDAKPGIPGLETTVPLILTEVFEGRLSWVEYLRVCSSGPARIFGLSGKGVLSPGYDADIIVVAKEEWNIKGNDFFSKSKITPFEGWRVLARPEVTIVGGNIVFNEGRFVIGPGIVGAVPLRSQSRLRNT